MNIHSYTNVLNIFYRSVDENKKQKNHVLEENKPKVAPIVRTFEKQIKVNAKKVAAIKVTEDVVPFPDDFHNLQNLPSPPKERDKPPIVLRIFKGTSQLITETGTKADSVEDISLHDDTRIEDNQVASDTIIVNENYKENVINIPAAEPTVTTRNLRRRSPVKPPLPPPESLPVIKIPNRLNFEKSKSVSPEPAVRTRSLRRRSPEKSLSPDPVTKTRCLRRRSPEKSLSPEPVVKIRNSRRRSPEKSKSPSPERTITMRSLRRRPVASEFSSQPHTSPKRVLRSTKNVPVPGKIVITNLNSDHPSVYLSDDGASQPPLPSPSRKDSKECRSYSNKHKIKHSKAELSKSEAEPIKLDSESITPLRTESVHSDSEPTLEKVEQILADLKTDNFPVENVNTLTLENVKVPDKTLDEDRAELLQLLEDDEEEETPVSSHEKKSSPNANESFDSKTEFGTESVSCNTIVNSESQLKIKIKIPKPCRIDVKEVVTPVESVPVCDSQDSGIDVKWESENLIDTALNSELVEQQSSFEIVKDHNERLSEGITNGDPEIRNEMADVPHNSAPLTTVIKKGSIFKHRGSNDGNKKRLALYKHKWVDERDIANNAEDDKSGDVNSIKSKALDTMLDMELDDMPLTKFIRQPASEKFDFDDTAPVTGVKCAKKNKDVSQSMIFQKIFDSKSVLVYVIVVFFIY